MGETNVHVRVEGSVEAAGEVTDLSQQFKALEASVGGWRIHPQGCVREKSEC